MKKGLLSKSIVQDLVFIFKQLKECMGFVIVVGTVDSVDNNFIPQYVGSKTRFTLNLGLIHINRHLSLCGLILENFLINYPQKKKSYPEFYILTDP
jgi:hypothetical protein